MTVSGTSINHAKNETARKAKFRVMDCVCVVFLFWILEFDLVVEGRGITFDMGDLDVQRHYQVE